MRFFSCQIAFSLEIKTVYCSEINKNQQTSITLDNIFSEGGADTMILHIQERATNKMHNKNFIFSHLNRRKCI